MLFQVAILPASASGKWDYVLKIIRIQAIKKIVKDYLDEFHSALHLTWYSPVYKHLYLRDVIFDLNRDGSISNIQVHTYYGYGSLEPYTKKAMINTYAIFYSK